MKRNNIIIFILAAYYFLFPQIGYVWNGSLIGHFLYSFSHANIFHLIGNCFVIWLLKNPIKTDTLTLAILCSFLPCFTQEPTMGVSGIIFAHIGMTWAVNGQFSKMCKYVLPITIITGLLPGVNMMIHIYCLLAGYLYNTLFRLRYA